MTAQKGMMAWNEDAVAVSASDKVMSSARGDAEALRLAADTAARSFRQRHATTRGAMNGDARYGSARALAGLGRESDRA